MLSRALLGVTMGMLTAAGSVQAQSQGYLLFSLEMQAKAEPSKKISVELYSLGADGVFLWIDGKAVGKVDVIAADDKFTEKRYSAGWKATGERFACVLKHRTKREEQAVAASDWSLIWDKEEYVGQSAQAFPKAGSNRQKVVARVTFFTKPGGLVMANLKSLLYPLPIEPYLPEEKVEPVTDASGTELYAARISITSAVPTEHLLAYIRATSLTFQVDVFQDEPVPGQ